MSVIRSGTSSTISPGAIDVTIESVALRLQSSVHSGLELTAIVGARPTTVFEMGAPVSRHAPAGLRHEVTTWILEAERSDEPLDSRVEVFHQVLDRLAVSSTDQSFWCDLVVAVVGKPLGLMVELSPAAITLLARARCGLVIDAYAPEPDGDGDE